MGYNTDYEGVLLFSKSSLMNLEKLRYLDTILDEDFREHSDWHKLLPPDTYLTYINLELTQGRTGLEWSGNEKSHDMVDAVNLIKTLMEKKFKDKFYLEGKFLCQGESIEDRWLLMFDNDGIAFRQDITVEALITCPNCGHKFELGS